MKISLTYNQMIQKLVDFHFERINRVYSDQPLVVCHKLNDFSVESYLGKSQKSIEREYDSIFSNEVVGNERVEIQSTFENSQN